MKLILISVLILILNSIGIDSHGLLLNPPARSSAWREDPVKFPVYYGDNQMFCGGFQTQWGKNRGRCGICGEDYSAEKLFEKGGVNYRGYAVRTYQKGQTIDVDVEITANHKGYFEFRLCNTDELDGGEATQSCLNRIVLKDKFGRVRIPIKSSQTGVVRTQLVLPKDLTCEHCVFQWKYNTGNSYGVDPVTKEGCIGCGPQEQFYGCSDIKISSNNDKKRKWSINAPQDINPYEGESEPSIKLNSNQFDEEDLESDVTIPKSLLEKIIKELKRLKKLEKLSKKELVNPDQPRPSQEFGINHYYKNDFKLNTYNENLNERETIVNPDQPRPSQEYGKNINKKRETIVYPDQPRPSQEFEENNLKNYFSNLF